MTRRPALLARQALTDTTGSRHPQPTLSYGPGEYIASSDTATFLDYLMDQAGVDKNSCYRIELVDGVWEFSIFCCDRNGRVRIDSEGAISHTEVWAA